MIYPIYYLTVWRLDLYYITDKIYLIDLRRIAAMINFSTDKWFILNSLHTPLKFGLATNEFLIHHLPVLFVFVLFERASKPLFLLPKYFFLHNSLHVSFKARKKCQFPMKNVNLFVRNRPRDHSEPIRFDFNYARMQKSSLKSN